ncbi:MULTISPECIES: TIGR01212 family radical SAM protein [Anaerostipes]|uniref:TIGR01212 family radical SAM protein n=2 Tax=Anaerostipes TaxID=207244 RepID=A0A916VEJ0_9FIRM|nr:MULTISPECIES: TIGR01212 family radical SAM protein [Anaerostipes]GFO85927.1 TIGR01212 family radical SAM protein [Anaerostipes butyraticus]HJC49554.1 TIGR01212 family radical SAM protein [Candidatus Anaerostipes avistercoris]HJC82093.1 TIGR01212 family radical SAM protein [Candidatus Anaerostipes avicola]
MDWHGKRYYSFDSFLKNTFGEKIYKVSLDGGFTCPNRDGTIGTGGCIFCSEGGSGDFASDARLSIQDQITQGISLVAAKNPSSRYIAYFQAFTNTYAPVSRLRQLFTEAMEDPRIAALAIGTRPDCLPSDVLSLLKELNNQKPVFVELGLQTIHPSTAGLIRRGYPLSCFEEAVWNLSSIGVWTVVHLILGLPGETEEMMLESVRYLNSLPVHGVKFSMLHILKGTDLADMYREDPFPVFTMESYIDLILRCIGNLRKDIVIHRLTGDGPRDLLIAPLWSLRKRTVLNEIAHQLKVQDIRQGDFLLS